ncbi:external alternative NAD(P)H-ubiquinone oxidoreductase B1, mitochondrial-like [Lotus japonicus]|uniref:external alternative NAD(P)H-ubiquinone oxidoreductase B1, mitochondrial-like n=1 Tax=Lotus japonicus TaxID=34305 RepID=UPI00258704F0|nr:external alternative NAD(P)H-ubiquinone oxidoreductase B1, mitochondrial-like [Lotus japonicus]
MLIIFPTEFIVVIMGEIVFNGFCLCLDAYLWFLIISLTFIHFAIVGGGPTGVEFAASLHDFVDDDLVRSYPVIKDLVKITLLEAGDHILGMQDELQLLARQHMAILETLPE